MNIYFIYYIGWLGRMNIDLMIGKRININLMIGTGKNNEYRFNIWGWEKKNKFNGWKKINMNLLVGKRGDRKI